MNDKYIKFSDEAIHNFIEAARILKNTHIRLKMEGYKIEQGKITPPSNLHMVEDRNILEH